MFPRVDFGGVLTDGNLQITMSRTDDLVCLLFIYWAGKSTLYVTPVQKKNWKFVGIMF